MPKKNLSFTVETLDGDMAEVVVNEENKVENIIKEAMRQLDIDPGSAIYELRHNGQLLNPQMKVESCGLTDKAVLVLRKRPKVG